MNPKTKPRAAAPAPQYPGPQFTASRPEVETINKIANRAVAMAAADGVKYDKQTAVMDLEACHCTGCPLELDRLLAADDATFGHDVYGIRRFMDRSTGQLTRCFLPRTARREQSNPAA